MKIKEWIYNKIQDEARMYNRFIDVADASRNEVGAITADEDGYIEVIVEEKIKETEKAFNVKLSTGEVDGSYMGWNCWIPKSQIK